jgi:hypothetical protein
MDSVSSDSVLNDNDLMDSNDDDGIESSGWHCTMISLPITYLQMWLHEKPGFTQFFGRKIHGTSN